VLDRFKYLVEFLEFRVSVYTMLEKQCCLIVGTRWCGLIMCDIE
jgi:hypothetical protein